MRVGHDQAHTGEPPGSQRGRSDPIRNRPWLAVLWGLSDYPHSHDAVFTTCEVVMFIKIEALDRIRRL